MHITFFSVKNNPKIILIFINKSSSRQSTGGLNMGMGLQLMGALYQNPTK
ncbi:hypothetical protein l11_09330 [Neisseria weaveri LMG 5135]|nr:hypothetical protein l11_09330 [Neisseria weaveri LMG 5135]